jgi:tRNA pseudouridine(55) synthase
MAILTTAIHYLPFLVMISIMSLPKYVVLDKQVGETPLACMEAWRAAQPPAYHHIPLAYAGRLDPLASGKLLVLVGDECKKQESYHGLDKRYEFSVLLGISSDTGDVMGRLMYSSPTTVVQQKALTQLSQNLVGDISFQYPAFSSKTVHGKPLHTWSMEGRLHEISIPTYTATIYALSVTKIILKTRLEIYTEAIERINTIPPVTEIRKALGNDFRRSEVRSDWQEFLHTGNMDDTYTIVHFGCICSSGLYMRTLAGEIGRLINPQQATPALAFHIHRTHIGSYVPLPIFNGLWGKLYM